jgi:biopolymer transport protein ExbD
MAGGVSAKWWWWRAAQAARGGAQPMFQINITPFQDVMLVP